MADGRAGADAGQARALSAATLGMSSGLSLNVYVNSTMAPFFIRDLGWSRTQFALLGTTGLLVLLFIPIAGRLADLYGVRRVAAFGAVCYPLTALAFSAMPGSIGWFVAIALVQIALTATTTATVWCRLVAERFGGRRGLALAIAAAGPALMGAIGPPMLRAIAEAHGWRAAYQALALFSALVGGASVLLAPSSRGVAPRARTEPTRDYRAIFASRTFWILIVGTFLCSLPQALAHSQLAVMLDGRGFTVAQGSFAVSIFAIGTMIGRFALGLALDRFATWAVTMAGLSASGFGLLLLAIPGGGYPLAIAGVALMGMAFGAEGDILGYVVARYFGVARYSTVLGMLIAAAGGAGAAGAIALSRVLAVTGSFQPFMLGCGLAVLAGSLVFTALRRAPTVTA